MAINTAKLAKQAADMVFKTLRGNLVEATLRTVGQVDITVRAIQTKVVRSGRGATLENRFTPQPQVQREGTTFNLYIKAYDLGTYQITPKTAIVVNNKLYELVKVPVVENALYIMKVYGSA